MPVSIVVGGQFGSEGKGKVALELARRTVAAAAVRVGGTNSGHTVVDRGGRTRILRQLPGAAVDGALVAVLPPGSYIEPAVLLEEIDLLRLPPSQVAVDPDARIITEAHKAWERAADLGSTIGSTQSGTGAAVIAAAARGARNLSLPALFAKDIPDLQPFIRDTSDLMRSLLNKGAWVIIEGTQGFGLSVLHSGMWPKATSRDTTAAGFLAEAGLSPLDVADITLVIRAFPIRVAGNSGPLPGEIAWSTIAENAGLSDDFVELTTVTRRVRRVAKFDAEVVRRAILVNTPTRVVLNHLDYIDPEVGVGPLSEKASNFIGTIEREIGRKADWFGLGPATILERSSVFGEASIRPHTTEHPNET